MAKRNYGTGSMYSAAVDAIDPRTKAEERENTAAITQRFTPMSPAAGLFRPGPSIGPTASPRDTMVPDPPFAQVPAGNHRLVTGTPMSTPAAVTPGLGPRAPVAPPVAVDPSVSGAGFTVNPLGTSPVRQGQAADQTPVAPAAASPLPENDFADPADDGLAGGAANAGVAPVAAQPAAPTRIQPRGQFAPNDGMQSDAARRMAVGFMANSEQVRQNLQGGPVRRIDPNSIQGQQLRSRWEEAAQKAMEGAMSPQQWTRYKEEQEKRRMENVADYNATPAAIEGEAARKRDVDVAQAVAWPKAAEVQIELAKLKQQGDLTAAQMAQAERLAIQGIKAEDARTQVIQAGETARETSRNQTQKEVAQGRKLTMEEREDKFITEISRGGMVTPDQIQSYREAFRASVGDDPATKGTAAERAKAALRGTPSLSSPAFQDGAMMTKGGKTYKRTNGVWVAQ